MAFSLRKRPRDPLARLTEEDQLDYWLKSFRHFLTVRSRVVPGAWYQSDVQDASPFSGAEPDKASVRERMWAHSGTIYTKASGHRIVLVDHPMNVRTVPMEMNFRPCLFREVPVGTECMLQIKDGRFARCHRQAATPFSVAPDQEVFEVPRMSGGMMDYLVEIGSERFLSLVMMPHGQPSHDYVMQIFRRAPPESRRERIHQGMKAAKAREEGA